MTGDSDDVTLKDDEKIILLIARVLGAAIFWMNEYQKIYQDAIQDGLTGLLNHKTFMERASEEIERARRFQHHLVFLNHFRYIMSFGHFRPYWAPSGIFRPFWAQFSHVVVLKYKSLKFAFGHIILTFSLHTSV